MIEPSVEEIVARLEADLFTVTQDDIRALIASWRERGEALEEARLQLEYLDGRWPTGTTPAILARIAALKDKP
jgi:hypothetical protein